MNDDMEQRLGRVKPRGVRAELRLQVLAAVASELASVEETSRAVSTTSVGMAPVSPSPWLRWSAMGVAASILLGIGVNVWVNEASKRRLAQRFGPPEVLHRAMEVTNAIEEIVGPGAVPRGPRNARAEYATYCATVKRLVDELQTFSKEFDRETPKNDSEMDRSCPGRSGGDRSGC
jgi:hypothetical protein